MANQNKADVCAFMPWHLAVEETVECLNPLPGFHVSESGPRNGTPSSGVLRGILILTPGSAFGECSFAGCCMVLQ